MEDEPKSLANSLNSDIFALDKSKSSLDPIQASLYQRMELAKTPEETQGYLRLIEQRQRQLEQEKYTNFELSQRENQLKYERKLAVYREVIAVILSITAIVLGMLTIGSIPLIAPFLIILGLTNAINMINISQNSNQYNSSNSFKFQPVLLLYLSLSLLAIALLLVLIFFDIYNEIKQVVVVVIGVLLLASFVGFKRIIESQQTNIFLSQELPYFAKKILTHDGDNKMSIEMLVGLNVCEENLYQVYREEMTPILKNYGGGFGYDFKISEVLKAEVNEPINRVFTIYFESKESMDKFFADEKYLEIKKRTFENSVTSTTIISTYER